MMVLRSGNHRAGCQALAECLSGTRTGARSQDCGGEKLALPSQSGLPSEHEASGAIAKQGTPGSWSRDAEALAAPSTSMHCPIFLSLQGPTQDLPPGVCSLGQHISLHSLALGPSELSSHQSRL